MTSSSLLSDILDRCRDAMFTGVLRVRARQAEGEIWFLSGILEWQKFGVSVGDEAMTRLQGASDPRVEAIPCLPNPSGGFRRRMGSPPFGLEGKLGETLPVDLLRFCETHALTCRLELQNGAVRGEAVYRLGDLVQIRCDGDLQATGKDPAVAQMLEWSQGEYRVVLPTVELPEGVKPPKHKPKSAADDEEEAPASQAEAWRRAMNEAVKRKAEAVVAKHGAGEGATLAPPPSVSIVPAAAIETPKPQGKRGKQPTAVAMVRLRRVSTEEAEIAVPLTSDLLGPNGILAEATFASAVRLAGGKNVKWRSEGGPRVEVHPAQGSPIASESTTTVSRSRTAKNPRKTRRG